METNVLEILVSTIGSATLLSFGAWLARAWIEKRLTASIHLETEQKLAKLKSELDSANQRIRDLSAVATSANQQVEAALLEHRISAVTAVWALVQNWQQVSVATMFVSALPEEWVKKHASHHETKSTFDRLLDGIDTKSFLKEQSKGILFRPFLSETAWALYFAFHSFNMNRLTKAMLLSIPGIDHATILARISERELVAKSSTPEILAAFDENSYAATEPFLHHLREELLKEFREMLSGHRAGSKALQEATEIVRAAEALSDSSSKNLATIAAS